MDTFKSKIALFLILGLGLIQLSLGMWMEEGHHQKTCAFDEHCILQSIAATETAIPLVWTMVVFAVLVFALVPQIQFQKSFIPVSATEPSLRRTLKGVIQRE